MDIAEFERSNFAVLGHPGPGGTLQSVAVVPPTIAHGSLYSISVPSAGTKTDYNDGNYTFMGHRHMHRVFTDLENATTQEPAANTEAGWKAHTGGIKPILLGTIYNDQATASGATVELTGGPTPSGKFLQRRITTEIADLFPSNSRLRNWLLDEQGSPNSIEKVYSTFYCQTLLGDYAGKIYRMFVKAPAALSENMWVGFDTGNQLTWRAEDGEPLSQYSDQTFELAGEWHRFELFFDYVNDVYAITVDGETITMVSRDKNGYVSGFIGIPSEYTHAQLGNTIQTLSDGGESGVPVKWAQPAHDYDWRRVMIADSDDWSTKTQVEPCPAVSWVDGNIQFVVNQGAFADLVNKHIFYVDGLTATYVRALT